MSRTSQALQRQGALIAGARKPTLLDQLATIHCREELAGFRAEIERRGDMTPELRGAIATRAVEIQKHGRRLR